MGREEVLDRGRLSYVQQAWRDAYLQLLAADRERRLQVEDLERLAVAAFLAGMDADSDDAWQRAHREWVRRGQAARAARCAFWLAFRLLNADDLPRASGWIGTAERLLDGAAYDGVECGYLRYLVALRAIFQGDAEGAYTTFGHAVKIGARFADPDLLTLALHGQGRALIYLGRIAEGVALLDEAMVAITQGGVSPIIVGDTYCSVIEACQQIFDVRRAQAWTEALSAWCESQPGMVPYRGQCLVHRAEILQLRGAWRAAVDEALRACERLTHPAGQPAAGAALYQRAELHRLRGEFAEAEEAYRRASECGRDPQPGLALLRLAQGRTQVAAAAIRRAVDEAADRTTISRLQPAYVEIMLASGDKLAARRAAEELSELATSLDVPLLRAVAGYATGAVLLAHGDAQAGLIWLRRASTAWRELDAPYEVARARVKVGLACRALGDVETARLELAAARATFAQLGAAPDLARLEQLARSLSSGGTGAPHGLSPRELQVLRLIARGETNRAIGAQLGLSERTVDRHVSNIFAKLDVPSRAAATAYAYEHQLI